MIKLKLSCFGHITKAAFFKKDSDARKIRGSRKRGRPHTRRTDSLKEATGVSVQEPSRAVEDRTPWTSLLHTAARSRSRLVGP